MFKRLFWLTVGAGFGFGLSFWLTRLVRETMERYSPERMSNDLADAIRSLGADVREAMAEGRSAMHQREAQLRSKLEVSAR
jgi:hypothetical protein